MNKTIFNRANRECELSDVFPFEFIEDDFLISRTGTVSAGFRLESCPDSGTLSEDSMTGLHYSLVQALSNMPAGTIFQKLDVFYAKPFVARDDQQSDTGFLGKRWAAHYHYRPSLSHSSFLFLIFNSRPTTIKNSVTTNFSQAKKRFQNPLEDIEYLIKQASTSISACLSALSMISGLKLARLNDTELRTLVVAYFNLGFDDLKDRLTDKNPGPNFNKSLSNRPQAFKIGQSGVSMISMTGQGPEVYSSASDRFNVNAGMLAPVLAELGFEHIVTQSILICDTQSELRKLDMMRSMLHSLAGQRDQDGAIQESGLQTLSAEIRKQGHELVKLSLHITLYHADPAILSRQTDQALSALKSINGTRACIESFDTANLFFASLPGNAAEEYRWILMPSENAACYLNFQQFHRTDQEGLLLCDRYKQPIYINFWNEGLDNKNKLIIGPSGSGKSFTVNSFITQHCHDGDQVVIIDVGGSYKGLFQIHKGKYIEYSSGNGLRFNPFACEKDDDQRYRPNQEKINFLLDLITLLWKARGEELAKTERTLLSQHILAYYNAVQKPGMNSFFSFLSEAFNKDKSPGLYLDLGSLLIILEDYTSNGSRPYLLNSTEEIDLKGHKLICFDMNGIKEDEMLFPVVSLIVIELVVTKIKHFPARRKHIYIDEAWSMLKDTLGGFVMNMFRTIRKSNGAITIITQGIDEIEQSPVGKAILQNAATKILLDHSSATQFFDTLKLSLGLTEHEMDLVRSIRKNDAEGWREFFVKFGSEARVLLLDAPPEARVAFDSRIQTRENLRVKALANKGSFELAIDEIIEEGRGGRYVD